MSSEIVHSLRSATLPFSLSEAAAADAAAFSAATAVGALVGARGVGERGVGARARAETPATTPEEGISFGTSISGGFESKPQLSPRSRQEWTLFWA
eukprot:jgi/Chrpa1/9211/Chrysochromulina_OHIO_Genome00019955-RA